MLDLDGFREINDRHGFHAGDRYLRAVGRAVAAQLRRADLGCRYGGDEFAVLLPETAAPGARVIAERMRGAIAALVVAVDGAALRGTVSIGVAAYPEHEAGESRLLVLRADHALYQAKRGGRDRVVPFSGSA
jgi:diguanylate cyclase (GGDEF)-like protein